MQQIYDTSMDMRFSVYHCIIILDKNVDSDYCILSNVSILYSTSYHPRSLLVFFVGILLGQTSEIFVSPADRYTDVCGSDQHI